MEIIVLLKKVYAALQSKETLHYYLAHEMGELLYDLQDDLYQEALEALQKCKTGEKSSWEEIILCLSKAYERFYQKGSKPTLFWLSQKEALYKQGLLIKAFTCALLVSLCYHYLLHHYFQKEFSEQSLLEKRTYIQATNDGFELYVESTISLAIIMNSSSRSHPLYGDTSDKKLDNQIKLERSHWHLLRELLNK
jgi:hypothetical protein